MGLICKICFEAASSQGSSGVHARITPCGHVFCQPCATTWFRSDSSCPVCRFCVNGLSSLIALYDQDAGLQSSPCESSDDSVANTSRDHFGDHFGDNHFSTAAQSGMVVSTVEVGSSGDTGRPIDHRDIERVQRHGGDDEDVHVRFVLGKVAERWQHVMVERAKLKVQVARLDKTKNDLLEQLQRLTKENNALRDALHRTSCRQNHGKAIKPPTDMDGQCDNCGIRVVEITAGGSLCSDNDHSFLPRLTHTEPACNGPKVHVKPLDKVFQKLQASKWELVHTFGMHSGPVHGIAVNPAGNLVATASWDHLCKVYDIHLEEEVAILSGHDLGLYAVKFSPSKCNVVGTVSSDHTCRLWNAENGVCLCVLEGHIDEVNGIAFKNATHFLATASDDMMSKIWDAEKGICVTSLRGHRHGVYGVCFQPQGHLLATASFDLTAKLWDPRSGQNICTLHGHSEDVIGIDFDSSGNILATGSDDKTCRVWDIRIGNELKVLEDHGGEVKRVAFSPFSRLLATTCGDTTVRLFDTATFECLHILSSHSDHVFDVAWSPTAGFLVTASHDHLWKLWSPKSDTPKNNIYQT